MTNLHQAWGQLTRIALLGTSQTPEPVPALPGLGTPDQPVAGGERERQVLLVGGALALVRKAGYQPPIGPAAVLSPSPPPSTEVQTTLGPGGRQYLHLLLEGTHADLLPEYLQQLGQHGRRVPAELLVSLLEYVRSRPELHAVAGPVLGERGRWLAALNPQWQPLLAALPDSADETVWETGTPRQRSRWLAELRRTDPARARELLAAALPQEPAKNQAQLLEVLAENLGPDDEALLLQYLASKSKEVRQTVLPLLGRLPGSALAQRLWLRTAPLLTLKRTLLSKKLVVTLPEAWDKSWLADGIEQKDGRFEGEKAAWLGQLLALLPPQRWAAHWNLKPAGILDLAAGTEWVKVLLPAWAEAAILHQDAAWATALLEWYYEQPRQQPPALPLPALAHLLTPARLTELVLPLLNATPQLAPGVSWLPLLQLVPAPWPAPLTRRVVELLADSLRRPEQLHRLYYPASQLLDYMTRTVPAAQYELCAASLQPLLGTVSYLHSSLNRLLDTLHFRQQLAATLTEPPDASGG
ncbi:DUF5691 domain-containing protein [Hymenobacter metallicola]|uniref:Uncharacterized protein n=1 Tax=Hymenobacter metallicola TaxID=2563114 RepID=A0A4Z0QET5_9BACT|nr:DUF5691 domain-containing protein [Hymenobacter metallicola]TGE28557.1 hypothetical protein E5K02_03580 [Hymenobacter metallicola]